MIYDYHVVFSAISILVAAVSYGLYIRSILRGETKPHIFTWLILGSIDAVVFAAQVVGGAGIGAYPLGASILIASTVAILSIKRGEKHITKLDSFFFVAAIASIIVWVVTKEPLSAVLILTVVNVLGTAPTFRKSYGNPHEESLTAWAGDIIRFLLSLVALEAFSLTTALFPICIILTNTALVGMILIRRRQLNL